MKWWPSCLAVSPQSNRVEGLKFCSPCVVSQDCDLLPTSGTCSHDFSSQSRRQWNLHKSNFTAQHVCDYKSNPASSALQYVKVKWLCMLHKLDVSVEMAGWNADLYAWDLCDCYGVYMWVTDGGILLLSSSSAHHCSLRLSLRFFSSVTSAVTHCRWLYCFGLEISAVMINWLY